MALATQCPHCHTTFRVVHDQLKLRAGLVRCGSCKQIFNGIEHLLRPDQVAQVPTKNPPASTPAPISKTTTFVEETPVAPSLSEPTRGGGASALDFVPMDDPDETVEPPAPENTTAAFEASPLEHFPNSEAAIPSDDPLQRMTLMDFTQIDEHGEMIEPDHDPLINDNEESGQANAESEPEAADELDRAIEDLQQKPWRGDNKAAQHDPADDLVAAESDEPEFVTQGRRKARRERMLRSFLSIASLFLLLGLIAQGAYVFRNQIAARFPETKPVLAAACDLLDCQVTLPMHIDAVIIESSELQTLAPQKNTFALTILMRNYSATAQAWPNIELTLRDANQAAVVRRIFTPRDYLPPKQDMSKGFTANSEQPLKILFEINQIKASGYNIDLFYP